MSSAALAHPSGISFSFALPVFDRSERQIGIAVAVSLLIHGIALGWLPGLTRTPGEPPRSLPPLEIRLARPTLPAEAIAVAPAPTFEPRPSPIRREAAPLPRPATPVLAAATADAAAEAPALRVAEAPLAVTTEAVRPPAVTSPPRPPLPDAGVLAAYGRELAGAVATRQRYPRLAQLRQWQGTAVLQLELAATGGLLGVRVLSSSGHDVLDRQALDMVREAVPLPPLPTALAGRPLTVDVPVVFRLAS